jgi:hypothetical protein
MAYGLELQLDPPTEATVWELRRTLAAAGLPTLAATRECPHLSLVRFDTADPAAAGRALAAFAAGESPLDLVFPCLGVFTRPAAFVFLGPVVSVDLLAFHRRVHTWAAGTGPVHNDVYVPGRWVPHCSLTLPLTPAQLPTAVAACQAIPFPLVARGARLGMTHYPPVVEWHSFELGTGHDRDA